MNIEIFQRNLFLTLITISFGIIVFYLINRFTKKDVLRLVDTTYYDII